MKRFYFAGQASFGNRGCEALVRTTVMLLKQRYGDIEALVPSANRELDSKQWPSAEQYGVRWVNVVGMPALIKKINRLKRYVPFPGLDSLIRRYPINKQVIKDIAACNAVLMIGGDNISLDYGRHALLWHVHIAESARSLGIPVVIWAGSVGPFGSDQNLERSMSQFLDGLTGITIREPSSYAYLKKLGVQSRTEFTGDPAFLLEPESVDINALLPELAGDREILGFNLSPIIETLRPDGSLVSEVAAFLDNVTTKHKMAVLLIPHVDPLGMDSRKGDSSVLHRIKSRLSDNPNVHLVPKGLNAAQTKYVISKCTLFYGARTHSTVASFSTFVPTVSIAYSAKARGINQDLFGNERLVLEGSELSAETLEDKLQIVIAESKTIRSSLPKKIDELRRRAHLNIEFLETVVP